MVKTVVGLCAVLMLVYLVVGKGFSRLAHRQGLGQNLRVVDRVGLDSRRTLYLVDADGHRALVAASEHAISMLVLPAATREFPRVTVRQPQDGQDEGADQKGVSLAANPVSPPGGDT
jgi:flagellar biogenesis protein FliO